MAKKSYPIEFKREAVRLAKLPGASKVQVAKDLGLHNNVIGRWLEQEAAGRWDKTPASRSQPANLQQENERLRRELLKAQTERDILKKAVAYFAREPK
jgi:transposase